MKVPNPMPSVANSALRVYVAVCGCVIMLMSCPPDADTSCLVGLDTTGVPTSQRCIIQVLRGSVRVFFGFSAKLHGLVILGKSCQGIY